MRDMCYVADLEFENSGDQLSIMYPDLHVADLEFGKSSGQLDTTSPDL